MASHSKGPHRPTACAVSDHLRREETMRAFLFCAVLVFLCSPDPAIAQGSRAGIKGGLNFSTIGGDLKGAEANTGIHVGFVLLAGRSGSFAIQPELVYSQQGTGTEPGIDFNYNYMNIPVVGKFYLGETANVQIGPQIGFLMTADASDGGESVDVKDSVEGFDFGIALGLGFEAKSGFMMDMRYNLGLTNTAKDAGDFSFPNRTFQVSLGYLF